MIQKHKIILIAAVDRQWAIGKENKLIYNIPTDMRFFRESTMSNIVVYGWNTLCSFPQRKILPNRDNIILTSKNIACGDDRMYVAHSIDDVLRIVSEFDDDRPVFICGGASVYKQFMRYADEAYITKIDAETTGADAFFPNLDELDEWVPHAVATAMTDQTSGLGVKFQRYINVAVL